ncbi:hypothetical protein ACQP3C_27615, partial [Escherichia coli]
RKQQQQQQQQQKIQAFMLFSRIYLLIIIFVSRSGDVCHVVFKGQLCEADSLLSPCMGSGVQTQVIMLAQQAFYLLSNLVPGVSFTNCYSL